MHLSLSVLLEREPTFALRASRPIGAHFAVENTAFAPIFRRIKVAVLFAPITALGQTAPHAVGRALFALQLLVLVESHLAVRADSVRRAHIAVRETRGTD